MEQDEGSRWREDQELLDFIYLISGFPLDCLCLQSSWARNPLTEYAHSQGSAALTERAHTQGQIFRGQRKWTITSRFKVNICTWLIFGRTPTECLILWMESFYLLMLCGPTQEKKCPLLWCSHLGDLSDSFHPPWASFSSFVRQCVHVEFFWVKITHC